MRNSVSAQFIDLQAAAQFYNGLIQTDQYDSQIMDLVRRSGVVGQRIRKRIASGDPSRWFIQTGVGQAQFTEKRNITSTPQSPTRTEGAVSLKAISGRIQFGLYDQLLGQVMPAPQRLKAQDLADMIQSVLTLHDKAIWTGDDTISGSLVGAGTSLEYVSIPTQITTDPVVVASNASIISAIRRKVAELMANPAYVVRPTAVYCHPMVIHFIEEEWTSNGNGSLPQVEVIPGVTVNAIRTAAGVLPLIGDPFIPENPSWASAPPANEKNYPFFIVDESLIEYHHLPGTDRPMLFQLGTTENLVDDYIALMFGGLVVKGGDVAHAKGVVQRG